MALQPLAHGYKRGATYPCLLLKTGQTTQYNSELDDGYYEAGEAKAYTVNTTGAQSGTTNVDLTRVVASLAVSFDAASKEIRGIGLMGAFKTSGGETIVISGSVSNNGVFTTKATGTADKIIVNETVTDESAGASVTIAVRKAQSNNTVSDMKTGLMWQRYTMSALGNLGTDWHPWTGFPFSIFAACAAANAASLGGYTDWRVPNYKELDSIADCEAPTSVPDVTAFPGGIADTFSSTTRVNNSAQALYVSYGALQIYIGSKSANPSYYKLILVRGGL